MNQPLVPNLVGADPGPWWRSINLAAYGGPRMTGVSLPELRFIYKAPSNPLMLLSQQQKQNNNK